jgi:hypothetical protein
VGCNYASLSQGVTLRADVRPTTSGEGLAKVGRAKIDWSRDTPLLLTCIALAAIGRYSRIQCVLFGVLQHPANSKGADEISPAWNPPGKDALRHMTEQTTLRYLDRLKEVAVFLQSSSLTTWLNERKIYSLSGLLINH